MVAVLVAVAIAILHGGARRLRHSTGTDCGSLFARPDRAVTRCETTKPHPAQEFIRHTLQAAYRENANPDSSFWLTKIVLRFSSRTRRASFLLDRQARQRGGSDATTRKSHPLPPLTRTLSGANKMTTPTGDVVPWCAIFKSSNP